jgi:hypothetical protein
MMIKEIDRTPEISSPKSQLTYREKGTGICRFKAVQNENILAASWYTDKEFHDLNLIVTAKIDNTNWWDWNGTSEKPTLHRNGLRILVNYNWHQAKIILDKSKTEDVGRSTRIISEIVSESMIDNIKLPKNFGSQLMKFVNSHHINTQH